MLSKNNQRLNRKRRILIKGTSQRPRVSIYRSLKTIYAQVIDDISGKTLAAACSRDVKEKGTGVEKAEKVGELLAQKAEKMKIRKVAFDRGGYKYHGKVKSLAEGARKAGLDF